MYQYLYISYHYIITWCDWSISWVGVQRVTFYSNGMPELAKIDVNRPGKIKMKERPVWIGLGGRGRPAISPVGSELRKVAKLNIALGSVT